MIRLAVTFLLLLCLQAISAPGASDAVEGASSFDASKVSRNPFERVEAKYLVARAVEVLPATDSTDGDLVKLFRVSAVSIDRLSIAVINRKAFALNEVFTVKAKDRAIRVRVLKVSKDGVELECDGKTLSVGILREWPASTNLEE